VAIDNTLGTLAGVERDLVEWMNAHPEDAGRVVQILTRVAQRQKLAAEKVQAWTMIIKES
jgi:hypothetical protein